MTENLIEKLLLENIKNQSAFFVFPTQTSADLWADRIVSTGSAKAVAMERFLVWDKFKSSSIRSRQLQKTSVPSAMRSIFVSNLIEENARKPFLKNLISPEYADSASGFTKWLAGLIPSLFTWKNHFQKSGMQPDQEDQDLLELYKRYSEFLDQHNFFDPAWETPPFVPDGNHYFIFFPEILSDYSEYEQILENSPESITAVHVPQEILSQKPQNVHLMQNSRQEIRAVCLHLRQLHEQKNIPWNEIAVSVPDLESYGPYLERDLEIYQIPYVTKNAEDLNSTGAGNFFSLILNCKQQNFSFESIKNLLLNNNLPWKDENRIFSLIEFGKENNCVCSFEFNNEKIDIWSKSFQNPKENPDEQSRLFYVQLKKDINSLANSKNFAEIRRNYFIFREHFFDMSLCSENSDNILSRCVTELAELINLEENYHFQLSNPLSFYSSYLSGIKYLAQTKQRGVQILPYKLGSCAPFKAQVVLDSSQSGLSVVYKQLSFLRDDKRKILLNGKDDPNVSELFAKLYEMNSIEEPVFFTCAEKTFTGYAQASSYLSEIEFKNDENLKNLLENDFYLDEKKFFLNPEAGFPKKITGTEKKGIDFWKNSQKFQEPDVSESIKIEKNKIAAGKLFSADKKIQISSTTLKNFFTCPRLWAIEEIGKLSEQKNEAEIADHRMLGNLYHKIFELFCKELKSQNIPLQIENDSLPENLMKILREKIDEALLTEKNSYLSKELLKTTKSSVARTAVNAVSTFSKIFQGCTVFASEEKYFFTDEEKNCIFNGRIDCILLDPSTTELFLVDFKSFTSAIPENFLYDESSAAWEFPDFQMPMYLFLLQNQKKPLEVENCCFFNVSKAETTQVFGQELCERILAAKPKSKKPKNALTAEDFAPTREKFSEAVSLFIQRIQDSDFSVSDEAQNFETCGKCRCKAVCRRTFNVSRQN